MINLTKFQTNHNIPELARFNKSYFYLGFNRQASNIRKFGHLAYAINKMEN